MLQVKEIETDKLRPWDKNPRINDHAVDAVAKSIKTFGFNVPIICDQNFIIIAGHTRWKAAQKLGLTLVPVTQIEMTESMRKAFTIADNKTGEIADWDLPNLREVLEEIEKEDFVIQDLGFSDTDLHRLFHQFTNDDDDVTGLSSEEEIAKPGDLWKLGNHRLFCGDSRENKSYETICEGTKVDHIFGDPPYYNLSDYAQWESFDLYCDDIKAIAENCFKTMNKGAILVWSMGYLAKV